MCMLLFASIPSILEVNVRYNEHVGIRSLHAAIYGKNIQDSIFVT
uniref:Uncharacterized protein n=1 Tax=Rhizophora mucronata TaxID=61149 RepID=A0A2P2ISN0_RHIMU